MFEGVEVGQVIGILTYDFPYIGRVVAVDDQRLTLADSVRVLWDGRCGKTWHEGKPPTAAEIEEFMPLFHVSLDDVRAWGPYPGGKIPNPQ